MREQDQRIHEAMMEAESQHPDLAELVELNRAIFSVQCEVRAEITSDPELLDEGAFGRLTNSQPVLTFDALGVEPDVLYDLTERIMTVLAAHVGEWGRMLKVVRETDPKALMALAKQLFDGAGQKSREWSGSSAFMAMAIGLSLQPFLERAAESVVPQLDLSNWHEAYCPVCGGLPDLAFLDENVGRRYLICARCSTQWPYVRLKCPFCGNVDQATLLYYPSDDNVYRLYVCEVCKHYLKTIDLRQARKSIIPTVERVLTARMDVSAQEKGYVV